MKKRVLMKQSCLFFIGMLLFATIPVLALDQVGDDDIISVSGFRDDDGGAAADEWNLIHYTSSTGGGVRDVPDIDGDLISTCKIVRRVPEENGCLVHFCEDDDDTDHRDDMAYRIMDEGYTIKGKIFEQLDDRYIARQGGCPGAWGGRPRGGPGGCLGDPDGYGDAASVLDQYLFRTNSNDIICTDTKRWLECKDDPDRLGMVLSSPLGKKVCIKNEQARDEFDAIVLQYQWVAARDNDDDGFATTTGLPDGALPENKVDCDDTRADVYPDAPEIPDDGRDNDCDGTIDNNHGAEDADHDGFRNVEFGGDDCDDANAAINLGAAEICGNGIDDNCDSGIDTTCQGDASLESCQGSGNAWVASGGGSACCGDDKTYSYITSPPTFSGEYWSVYGAGGEGTSACFATSPVGDTNVVGENLATKAPDFTWEGRREGSGLGDDTLLMDDTTITSSFIPLPQGFWFLDTVVLVGVNLTGSRDEAGSLRITVQEGARSREGGSSFEPFDTPLVAGSVDGSTNGAFIRLRYQVNGTPGLANREAVHAAQAANKDVGLRIMLEKNAGTIAGINNLDIFSGTPSQVAHSEGAFYACGIDTYENSNLADPPNLATLEYTNPMNLDPTGEPLIPATNIKQACDVVGTLYCDTDARWKRHTVDSSHPNSARKDLPGSIPRLALELPIFEGGMPLFGRATQVFDHGPTGLQFYGIPPGMFDAGIFGHFFGDDPASVSGFTELPPARSGCCPDNYCWNGYSCVEGKTILHGDEPPDVVFNGTSYSCVNGGWTTRDVKKDQFSFKTGYCPTEQCYFNDGDMTLTSDDRCVGSNFYDHDYYCEDGNWSTRTGLLAAQMLDGMVDDYELFCGEPETVLNDIDYTDVGVVKDFFYNHTGADGNYHCDPVTKKGCMANNVCVLHYTVGGDDYVRMGTSLNIMPDARGADRELSILKLLPESYNSFADDHQDFCDSVIAKPDAGNTFYGCNRNDDPIEGVDTNLWYNPKLNAIIYGKQGFTLEERDLAQAFKDFVKAPFSTIITRLAAALRIRSYAGDAEADFLKDATRYNNIYLSKHGSPIIRGLMDDVGNDAFMTVYYLNPGTDVCARLPVMTALSGCASPTTCTCQSLHGGFGTMNYQVSVKERNSFFLWGDLTGKIRLG